MPGAGAGALRTFYLEAEPEPKCFPGAGTVKTFHGSASLHVVPGAIWVPGEEPKGPLEQVGPLKQESTGSIDGHGAPEASWGP